jgi:hypothetical protein
VRTGRSARNANGKSAVGVEADASRVSARGVGEAGLWEGLIVQQATFCGERSHDEGK